MDKIIQNVFRFQINHGIVRVGGIFNMKNIYLLKYSVKGIKTLDELVSLSFYKKIIPKNPDTQEYNIKAIYGMNGTGKSAIVCSVEILKNLLVNEEYLTNPLVQKKLGELINKKTNELFIEADYLYKYDNGQLLQFYYNVIVSRTVSGKYVVSYEKLTSKNATSKSEKMTTIFEIQNGKIVYIERKEEDKEFTELLFNKTMNLLENSSMACLFMNKLFRNIVIEDKTIYKKELFFKLVSVGVFGLNLHAYMDQYDYHKEYLIENPEKYCEYDIQTKQLQYLIMSIDGLCDLKGSKNYVLKKAYKQFSKAVGELYEFLHIFKSDLKNIEIDRKENKDFWLCDLIMVYDDYKVHAEFESTGIKKLIRLFTYLQKMVRGEIVFIDEFDSNLHDVYLCAILEYLMEHGKGQLCFTTHNVGPMDVLRRRKKSIDFLSENHKIYPWTANGNYSPAKLYRNGMIEGSPFNVDSIDFIGVFDSGEEDE